MAELSGCTIGIELGSTRIKSVLIDERCNIVCSGSYEWENKLENGIWTYDLNDAVKGIQSCYRELKRNYKTLTGKVISKVGSIGISGMMHGYIVLDKKGNLLSPFRTWRNTITQKESEELSEIFSFNVPPRWSISHLYQGIRSNVEYIRDIDSLMTLSSYIHYLLTREKCVGIGDASGMFPVDSSTLNYDREMIEKFDSITKEYIGKSIRSILPKVMVAGENAGVLTKEGALLLDEDGDLMSGIPLCPPEGDAGTGMVATNSIKVGSGNVSAGTSIFAMIVTGKRTLPHREIDIVSTPDGKDVAMVHCNNCTSDINAWVNLFLEYSSLMGFEVNKSDVFEKLFKASLEGDPDCGGLVNFNYLSGEEITKLNAGIPLFLRKPDSIFSLSNFMRAQISSAFVTLKMGIDILQNERVKIERLLGHGGIFKTEGVAARILSSALSIPILTMTNAGEGGPYGMALLALYMIEKEQFCSLDEFLEEKVFKDSVIREDRAGEKEQLGFSSFSRLYEKSLPLESLAVEKMNK